MKTKRQVKLSQKTSTIGLFLTSLYDPYQNAIWSGVHDQAKEQKVRLLSFPGGALDYPDYTHISRNSIYNLVNQKNIDALLIITGSVGVYCGLSGIRKLIKKYTGIPVVSIGIDIPEITSIAVDNEAGMRRLIAHLIEVHNCCDIAFVKGPAKNNEANARFKAYKDTLKKYGLKYNPKLVCPGKFEKESGAKAVQLLIDKRKVTFDALVGVDDRTAIRAIESLKKRGFAVPDDIKVGGFDDVEESQSSFPPLTTVRQPLFEMGSVAVKNAIDLINNKPVPRLQLIPTNTVIRNSCGCSPHETLIKLGNRNTNKRSDSIDLNLIIDTLKKTFFLDLFKVDSSNLTTNIETLVELIIKSLTKPSLEKKILSMLKEIVMSFYDKRLTASLWNGIFATIFERLGEQLYSKNKLTYLNSLWNKCQITLYQTELHLHAHEKNIFLEDIELVERIGDKLITCFDQAEIKKILKEYLPRLNVHECHLAVYEKNKNKAHLIFSHGKDVLTKEGPVFIANKLIPDGFTVNKYMSYTVQALISEKESFGFGLFELSGTNGYLYETMAEKISSSINSAKLADEIKRQNIFLRESEDENFRIILNSIGDAVIATNARLNISRMNPMAEKLTGWNFKDAINRPLLKVFDIVGEEDQKKIQDSINEIIETGKVINLPSYLTLKSQDMREYSINFSSAPICDFNGKVVGAVLVFRDTTKQKHIEEQLRHTQKMDSIGQLAGGVAHDFNNMLAGISGAAEIIDVLNDKDEKIQKFVDMILDTSEKAASLTRELLAFSRKAKVQSVIVDAHDCVFNALQILEHSIDRRINIVKRLRAETYHVNGDPAQIQNIILNLGVNARDAMPQGGELTIATTNIHLDTEYCSLSTFDIKPGFFIEICVIDTGVGIKKEILGRIFDPFFTTKEVGKGTGLGLAAVYGMVRDHHGGVQVVSEPGKGTFFKVYFPIDKTISMVKNKKSGMVRTGDATILIVDDESIIRHTLDNILSDLGYTIMLAKDGEEGAEIFRKHHKKIDLVILDMIMPKMNGYDTFFVIRKIKKNAKVLLLSGFSRDEDMEELQRNGAVGFLQKPYKRVELSRVIADVL